MLSLTLVGGLTACSGASGGGKSPNVAAIQKRGVLKAGVKVDVPKFGYKDPATGKIDGFEVDLARAVAKKLLGDPNKIELTAVTAKTRAALLDSGELDLVAATFTITDDRKKVLNFTDPYFTDGIAIMVKKSSGFTSLKDLDKKNIGVAKSATTKAALQAKAQALGIQPNFLEFDSYPEIKAALDAGRVDAFSVDGAILMGYLDDSTQLLTDRYSQENYGIASAKSKTDLAQAINDVINGMKSSGELDQLKQKWGLK
ncbi:MAG: transporter substrate-binding domain-containing protein [Symbiobacteriia bacterium]